MAHYGWAEDDWPTARTAPRWPVICSSAGRRSPAVTSRTLASRTYPTSRNAASRSRRSRADGSFTITKAAHTGGLVDARTVKEQLLYEVHDPAAYLTPDVVADISEAEVREVGRDHVAVTGVRGHPRPAHAQGQCLVRRRLARRGGDLLRGAERRGARAPGRGSRARAHRRRPRHPLRPDRRPEPLRRRRRPHARGAPGGQRARRPPARPRPCTRIARASSACCAEVTTLYTCGPAGGGGVRTSLRPRLSTVSCFVPRERVPPRFEILD